MSNFIDVNLSIKSLEVMGLGMLGIFIVIAVISLLVAALNKAFSKKKKTQE